MRIRNLSGIDIPRSLWRQLASAMGLGGVLPQAEHDVLGMYETCKVLRATLRPSIPRDAEHCREWYTFGHITIFPCPNCAPAFLTSAYLDGLVSAWLHQFHEKQYEAAICGQWDDEALVSHFVDHSFRLLGGRVVRKNICKNYRLPIETAERNLPRFTEFAETLTGCKTRDLVSWGRGAKMSPTRKSTVPSKARGRASLVP